MLLLRDLACRYLGPALCEARRSQILSEDSRYRADSALETVISHVHVAHTVDIAGNDHCSRMFDVRRMSSNDFAQAHDGSAPVEAVDDTGKKKRVIKPRWAAHESQLVEMPHGRVRQHEHRQMGRGCYSRQLQTWSMPVHSARLWPDMPLGCPAL